MKTFTLFADELGNKLKKSYDMDYSDLLKCLSMVVEEHWNEIDSLKIKIKFKDGKEIEVY